MDELLIPGLEDDEYKKFTEKFKTKKTTDDCYTPPAVFDAVAGWVAAEYGLDTAKFVRPFYPGGDYQRETYGPDAVVVDNPPFSIITQIIRFYGEHGTRFFLFAPALTLFSSHEKNVTYLPCGVPITYANGAIVPTSFVTNLEPDEIQVRCAPDLYKAVDKANKENMAEGKKELPKYIYPDNIVTAAIAQRWCKYGVEYKLLRRSCLFVRELDAQKAIGKTIFGSGFLLSERAAAERAAAERTAANKWQLSTEELEIVRYLDAREEGD